MWIKFDNGDQMINMEYCLGLSIDLYNRVNGVETYKLYAIMDYSITKLVPITPETSLEGARKARAVVEDYIVRDIDQKGKVILTIS